MLSVAFSVNHYFLSIAGMLTEESPANARDANDLIGAFLLDVGVANDEAEALVSCNCFFFLRKYDFFNQARHGIARGSSVT